MTQRLEAEDIYRLFGVTPEEIAAFEATPEHQEYLRARAQAAAEEEDYRRRLADLCAATNDRINAELEARLNTAEDELTRQRLKQAIWSPGDRPGW